LVVLLAVCAIFFVFTLAGVIGFGVARSVDTEPAQVAQTASEIALFDLPGDYDERFAINALGFSMVGYDGADGHSHIMLAQIPGWVHVDRVELERQAREAARGQSNRWNADYRFEIIGEETTTIRGEEVTMTTGEGTSSEGISYREIIVPFEGKGGQALLILVEPVEAWDQARIDTFLASIR
jgi:hypothetical protein